MSEHTDRPELIDFLKSRLGIQFRVFQELIFQKKHFQEDIVIFKTELIQIELDKNRIVWDNKDAVSAIIETKIKGKGNLEQDELQLKKYCKELNCKIGFVTNYEDLIFYEYTPTYTVKNSEVHLFNSFHKMAEFISKKIENYTGLILLKEPEEILKDLENYIDSLIRFTVKIPGEEWEKHLRLNDEQEKIAKKKELTEQELKDRYSFFQRTAAYIAITQLLFYIVLRMYRIENGLKIPRLRPLSTSNGIPSQIQEIIEDIPNNNLNFTSIFGKSREVFSYLEDDASDVLQKIIFDLEGISSKYVIENDLIGQIFQRLMPFETRKKFAAYYTRNEAAELLCRLAINDKGSKIYDPACGSGTLLVKAYHRKKELKLKQHKKLLDDIRGSDISDIAAMMTTVNLAIQNPSKWTNKVYIYPHDVFSLVSGIERFFPIVKITANERKLVKPVYKKLNHSIDVLIANPPFTRGSRLTPNYRKKLLNLDVVKNNNLKLNFSSINLYAFFILILPQFVKKENGILAFILPVGAINTVNMVDVWKTILENEFGIKYLIEASDLDESFSDSDDHEIIIILQKNYDKCARFIKLFGILSKKDINGLVNSWDATDAPLLRTKDFLIQNIPQEKVKSVSCIMWNLQPSKMMLLLYSNFIPLNLKKLNPLDKENYKNDLSQSITVVTENASRPVDYWFLPNKYWDISQITEDKITIKATSKNTVISTDGNTPQFLHLPIEVYKPAISRTLKNYREYFPVVNTNELVNFFLFHEKHPKMKKYFSWGQKAHLAKLFGPSHSMHSPAKVSIGIVKKIDFKSTKSIALKFVPPKNGTMMIRIGFRGCNSQMDDLFFSYLTSSLFILDVVEKSRKRRAEFVLVYQIDLFLKFRFPDFPKIVKDEVNFNEIIRTSNIHNTRKTLKERPNIVELVKGARRNKENSLRKLDEAWFRALNIPIGLIDSLYQEIEESFKDIENK
nr:N-6 DNA Methylase [Candidatus Prometheoarchaeum syntrophicum]